MKTLTSLVLSVAIAVLSVNPVMGEEITSFTSESVILSTNPVEGGDTINDAVEVALETEFTPASNKTSWYKFHVAKKGAVRLSGIYNGTGNDEVGLNICDNDKTRVASSHFNKTQNGKQYSSYTYCNAGDTFYVGLDKWYSHLNHNETGYVCCLEFEEHIPWTAEWASKRNTDFESADDLSINAVVNGYIDYNYNADDFFKITVPKDGTYYLNNAENNIYCTVYDSTRAVKKARFFLDTNKPKRIKLSAGVYYVKLDSSPGGKDKYKFSITDESINKGVEVVITVGSDKYTVSCQNPVLFNGTKHFQKCDKKNTKSKSYDVEITVMKNGEPLPASAYSVSFKNNKVATVSSDEVTSLGDLGDSKKPYFTIKIKKAAKDVKNKFKKNKIYFNIAATDITADNVSYKKCKQKKDGSIKLTGVSYKNEYGFKINMKPINKKGKGDYSASLISGNTIVRIEGKNNYCGIVDLPLK